MKDYYLRRFSVDLRAFLGDSSVPYFGHAWSHHCGAQLSRVPAEHLPQFLVCLYFTVLVDQTMHAHFASHYTKFESLTRYPKFCHGLSQFQHNPRGILLTPVEQRVVPASALRTVLPEGMTLFVDEVVSFFREHMPEIDSKEFFQELLHDPDVQIPELLIMVDPTLKDDVVCIAYKAMREAVERALPEQAV